MSGAASQTTPLEQGIDAPDLQWPKFFNGRLLTGSDLDGEQRANRSARQLLGRALGAGVACGLDVTLAAGLSSPTQPVLNVACGLAVNRRGDALELASDVKIALSVDPTAASTSDSGFTVCSPSGEIYSASTGVFLFTIAPSSSGRGRAPVSGLGNGEASCNVAYNVDGVKFGLVALNVDSSLGEQPELLRNRLAHLMFGSADAARLSELIDPFAHGSSSCGLLDRLPGGCVADDCVPLAALQWTADGVTFVDRWAARRRIAAPIAADRWPTLIGDRRRAEAEAMFLQFEDQAEELLATLSDPTSVSAATYFSLLPAAGLLPINTPGASAGFDPATFFGSQASRDIAEIDAVMVPALLHESLWHEPIVVGGDERIQLYLIRENRLAALTGAARQAALLFAKRTLPYRGIARFGVARVGLSRFAPRVI